MHEHLEKNYKLNITGSLMGAFVVAVANYLSTYLKEIGGGDYHFAMLSAMPAIVAVIALIPGAMIIDSTKNKLRTTLLICFGSRAFFLLYALVPFLPRMIQPFSLAALVGLRNAFESVWQIGYQSLMADVFPKNELNEILGKRSKYNNILTIGATFVLGTYLTLYEKLPISSIGLFQILFIFTLAIGTWEIYQYSRFKFEPAPPVQGESFGKKLMTALKEAKNYPMYCRYCATVIVFYLGWQMAWPLYNMYQLNVLNANAAWMGYFNIASQVTQVLTIGLWVKLSKKIGSNFVLAICMFLMAISPVVYALSGTLFILLLAQFVVGLGTGGVNFLVFNELIYVAPEKNRTLYMSLFTCLTQITSSFMPFIGTFIKQTWSIYAALYISAAIRLIGAGIFLWGCQVNKKLMAKEKGNE